MKALLTAWMVLTCVGPVCGQIYSRDFKLIDQSDMIVSYTPELDDGRPSLSSGVERELQHAHEGTKEVYVIWRPRSQPSVFVTETAPRVFRSVAEVVALAATGTDDSSRRDHQQYPQQREHGTARGSAEGRDEPPDCSDAVSARNAASNAANRDVAQHSAVGNENAPGRTRTSNRQIRSLLLYPIELRAQSFY